MGMNDSAELHLERGMTRLERAVGLMEDGDWAKSILQAFQAARIHVVALLESSTGTVETRGGLTRLLRRFERENGGSLPAGLLEKAFRLDRMYILVKRNQSDSFGWENYPDEEQCAEMLHLARALIRYARGRINRPNSFQFLEHEGDNSL
jgi:HEPN domain-containing protein